MVTADLSCALSAQGLKHRRGTFNLGTINLDLNSGQCVALIGGNGAGKSTLLRCMAGLISPDDGIINLSGTPAPDPQGSRKLAYLPERFSPPHYLTGHEFLKYYLGLCEVHHEVSGSLLQTLQLRPDMLGKPVHKLSKGTAQKLGLAAVLSTNRPVMLMDEPFSGLDPEAREGLRTAMTAYVREGNCLLFSTHQFEGMDDFVARMVILHEGRIRFDGSPAVCRQIARQETLEQAYLHFIHQPAD